MLQNLCTPALIYLIFSVTQITIDIFKKDYNVALVKFFVAFIFTILLNHLCKAGLGIVSWIIVFLPFILMSIIVSYILTFFGIDPKTKKIRIRKEGETLDRLGEEEDEEQENNNKQVSQEAEDMGGPVISNIVATHLDSDNKIVVTYTSSKDGKSWCKAIKEEDNKEPTISEMKEGISYDMKMGDDNECNITDYLEGDEYGGNYNVYIYVEDNKLNGLSQTELIGTKQTVTTTELSESSDGVSGFQNMGEMISNFFNSGSDTFRTRSNVIKTIKNILENIGEEDNAGYFANQATTCANKKTNIEYEKCMKRVIQEVYTRINNLDKKAEFLKILQNKNINIAGIKETLI